MGAYDVTGIVGTRNGIAISGLLPITSGFDDNLLFASGPYFDQDGLGFSVGSSEFVLYNNSQAVCGTLGYREDNGSASPFCAAESPALTAISVTRDISTVPEPDILGLLLPAGLGLGLALARRRHCHST